MVTSEPITSHDHFFPSLSETVVPASAAGHDVALPTLVDEQGKNSEALFTFARAWSSSPSLVRTLVVLDQVTRLLLDAALSDDIVDDGGVVGSVHDGIGPVV